MIEHLELFMNIFYFLKSITRWPFLQPAKVKCSSTVSRKVFSGLFNERFVVLLLFVVVITNLLYLFLIMSLLFYEPFFAQRFVTNI